MDGWVKSSSPGLMLFLDPSPPPPPPRSTGSGMNQLLTLLSVLLSGATPASQTPIFTATVLAPARALGKSLFIARCPHSVPICCSVCCSTPIRSISIVFIASYWFIECVREDWTLLFVFVQL
ncbi:hypothetical protein CEXT_514881 [Caerostris extrusa]|uniref:Uncharacterized protein n=1 Tax=Caerostris extrusa TaxID=172846 RepID=A0AAV4SM80_CAEEX|nr:hypothetical protein CEXT_514881 [Caerostris extrusa]